jgi:hypothetical protein
MKTKKKSAKKSAARSATKSTAAIAKRNLGADLLDLERAREILMSTRDVDQIREIRDAAKLRAKYHSIRDHGVGAVNDAMRVVVLAQARLGAVLIEAKEAGALRKGQHGRKSTDGDLLSLDDLGISKDESSRCQKLAVLDAEGKLGPLLDRLHARGREITLATALDQRTSEAATYNADAWGTPSSIVERVRRVLGEIDLDPASNAKAQETVRATTFYVKPPEDAPGALGEGCAWAGRVFLNPPYSKVAPWIEKLLASFDAGAIEAAIVLVNNTTDTEWAQSLLARFPACFTSGRISFLGVPEGETEPKEHNGARQGQMLFYLGPDFDAFEREFADVGAIVGSSCARVIAAVDAGPPVSEWFADEPEASA